MKKLNFDIHINAPASKVWETLWNDETYRKWTAPFSAGSYAVSDWKQGSRVHFLNGEGAGMYSTIIKMIPQSELVFKHLGEIRDGKEQALNDTNKNWYGGLESYLLKASGDTTHLFVSVDMIEEYESYMQEKFPQALEILKKLCEA